MYCPNCGKEIDDGALICPECGALTGEEVSVEQVKERKPIAPRAMSIAGFLVSLVAVVSNVTTILSLFKTYFGDNLTIRSFFTGIFFLGIIGIVLSLVGWFTAKHGIEDKSKYKNTYAMAGIVLSVISLVLALAYCCVFFALLA